MKRAGIRTRARHTGTAGRTLAWLLVSTATLLLLSDVRPATAQIYDARGMGMGSVTLGARRGDMARVNPAYRGVPTLERGYGLAIPLPIGLLKGIGDLPSLDPDDEDFDLIAIADYILNFPWAFQFGAGVTGSDDVVIDVSRDEVSIDLGRAREQVPPEGFDTGGYRTLFDLGWDFDLGRRYGSVYVGALQAWEVDEIDVRLDDALVGVLRDGDPVVGGRTYRLGAEGLAQAGLSTTVGYAREIPLFGEATGDGEDWLEDYWNDLSSRPRLWAGVAVRRYYGIGLVGVEGNGSLTGEAPLLAEDGRFDLDGSADYVNAHPDGLGGFGTGWAVDLGMVLRWRDWEFGAGVADLFADLSWGNGDLERVVYDDTTDGIEQITVADGVEIESEIPISWRLNGVWRPDARTLSAVELSGGPGGTSVHAGGERWINARVALRGGLERDRREQWQAGAGVGLRFARVGFDLGIRSHSRNVRGEREVEMGLSLVFGAVPPTGDAP